MGVNRFSTSTVNVVLETMRSSLELNTVLE
jgi:hypothetical protein